MGAGSAIAFGFFIFTILCSLYALVRFLMKRACESAGDKKFVKWKCVPADAVAITGTPPTAVTQPAPLSLSPVTTSGSNVPVASVALKCASNEEIRDGKCVKKCPENQLYNGACLTGYKYFQGALSERNVMSVIDEKDPFAIMKLCDADTLCKGINMRATNGGLLKEILPDTQWKRYKTSESEFASSGLFVKIV